MKGVKIVEKTEQRQVTTNKIEVREQDDGTKTLSGYAVKWEKKSHVLGYYRKFREQFKRGAFADSLRDNDQFFLWSHDLSRVLGSTKNNTLRLYEDNIGLRFDLDLPDTTLGNDTYQSIKRGDVQGVSFGFNSLDDEIDEPDDDLPTRTVKKAKLIEVSAVALPAYPDSEVSARGYDPMKQHEEEQSQMLRRKLLLQTLI